MTATLLSKITRKPKALPPAVILYGGAGSGKSSFASHFPDPLFVIGTGDRGILTLQQNNLVSSDTMSLEVESHYQLLEFLEEALDTEDDLPFKYLVIDQFSVFQQYLFEYVCEEEFGGDWGNKGFANYQQGFHRSATFLVELLELFDGLRDRGIGIVLIAHSKVNDFDDPHIGHYHRYEIDAHYKMSEVLNKWADTVLFLDFETEVVEAKKGEKAGNRAVGGRVRKIYVEKNAAYDAKNRFGLTEPILGGTNAADLYANFREAIKTIQQANKKSQAKESK